MAISLPHDVFSFHILPRLPPKSLISFMCVSKLWHSFLSSDMFKKMYKRCHIDGYQNQHKVLVLTETIPCKFSTIDCEAPDNGLTPSRPLPFEGGPRKIKILASFHGLVCVGIISNISCLEYSHLILWNPLTNEYKTLSKSDSQEECHRLSRVFGLYYNSCEDDYKLLCVMDHKVYMYSLKSESWRKLDSIIAEPELFLGIESWSPGTCLNDNLYFLHDGYSIIRFDTKTEQFTRIATPTFDEDDIYNRCSTMMVQRGCIHFCVRYEIGKNCRFRKTCIRLWKMNGGGKWKEVVTYQPVSNVRFLKPLYLMRNGVLLLADSFDTGNLFTENQGHIYKVVCQKSKKHGNGNGKGKGKGKGKDDLCSLDSRGLRDEVRYTETFVSPNQHSK